MGPRVPSSLSHYSPLLHDGQQRRHMRLSPRELDHLRLSQVGVLAQRRLARGVRLNHPEAILL